MIKTITLSFDEEGSMIQGLQTLSESDGVSVETEIYRAIAAYLGPRLPPRELPEDFAPKSLAELFEAHFGTSKR